MLSVCVCALAHGARTAGESRARKRVCAIAADGFSVSVYVCCVGDVYVWCSLCRSTDNVPPRLHHPSAPAVCSTFFVLGGLQPKRKRVKGLYFIAKFWPPSIFALPATGMLKRKVMCAPKLPLRSFFYAMLETVRSFAPHWTCECGAVRREYAI